MANDSYDTEAEAADLSVTPSGDTAGVSPSEMQLVKSIQKTIAQDKAHHKPAFEQMRSDMYVARHGAPKDYPAGHYKANLCGRHVKQKTAALYAKNPKATAVRRETMDFKTWDENPQSLQLAMQTLIQMQQMLGGLPVDPVTGQPTIDEADPLIQQAMQAFEKSQEIVADYQQGMERQTLINKVGKTLEILYAQALREQKPVDFKTGMKQLVRRTCTTGVGYVELGFQREKGPRPDMTEKMADFRARLDHMKALTKRVTDTENPIDPDDPEIAELEKSIAALQAEPEVILREGLIIDFPQSTKVIPDKLCRSLVGFIGARHITLEYMYTCDEVQEIFGVDLGMGYKGYAPDGKMPVEIDTNVEDDSDKLYTPTGEKGAGLVCVWKYYDKPSGLVYYVADGYDKFLREPASPDVFVEDFWPVYALTFNAVESEESLFPPSDVYLMLDQQLEYNRSRQGMREHRKAARPRWTYQNGKIEEQDVVNISQAEPFTATGINTPPGQKLSDILDVMPVPGVDPNLYETGQLFTDVQLVVGSSEAQFGGVSKATATESAIAANSSSSSDNSSIDDLDGFLTVISRASGQILLREMSEKQVMQVVGVGAVWPHLSLSEIANELYLEVEAGSTGKPNQAVEIDNWQKLLPFVLQMPGVDQHWLLKETLRRLDDRMDTTEAFASGAPSIMAQNAMSQLSTGDAASDPNAQGATGGQNAPTQTEAQRGSEPAFGSNQV
ncbi:hypothetical protein [Nitratireductor soli]|uniref:hypothetical protein n=1 Tax=Nitratireductor soli TaxID=1670619 RepID=UPI00065E0076|nr:hypothetical protein [Nitratireductor soli]